MIERARSVYAGAIIEWGGEAQIRQTMEECAELIVALCKLSRPFNGTTTEEVLEEIADVKIMIEQMEVLFGEDLVHMEYTKKLKRLEKLLGYQY